MRVTLRDLNLSGNNFTTLPAPLMSLHALRNLYIGGNQINRLPRGINGFKKLKVLYLGGNFLRTLPEEISQLSHLVALILAENQLESLPDTISDLKKLQCLQLHKNRFTYTLIKCRPGIFVQTVFIFNLFHRLTTLPHDLVFLKSLRELSIRDNPLVVQVRKLLLIKLDLGQVVRVIPTKI